MHLDEPSQNTKKVRARTMMILYLHAQSFLHEHPTLRHRKITGTINILDILRSVEYGMLCCRLSSGQLRAWSAAHVYRNEGGSALLIGHLV